MNARDGDDDDTLIAAALGGDNAAFSALMGRHKQPLYRFVRRYVGDADESFDLVQETFVAGWSALNTFEHGRPFAVWLRRIALNKCRDWGRRRQVRRFFFTAAPLEAADTLSSAPADDGPKSSAIGSTRRGDRRPPRRAQRAASAHRLRRDVASRSCRSSRAQRQGGRNARIPRQAEAARNTEALRLVRPPTAKGLRDARAYL